MNKSFSISPEEIALSLGLINRPDLGKKYLKLGKAGSTEGEMNAALTAASHSLVAHGLADISEKGTPILDQEFELSLLPIARYDGLLQVFRTSREGNFFESIYFNRERKIFTAHNLAKGVVHTIKSGPIAHSGEYLRDLFPQMGTNGKYEEIGGDHHLTLALMGKLGLSIANEKEIFDFVDQSALSKDTGEKLKKDILAQEVRGSLLSMDVNSQESLEKQKGKFVKGLLLLKGPNASWVFNFKSANREEIAQVTMVDRDAFARLISEFAV
jgi:hypothetical protein